jgi:hypothetical protein
MALTGALQADFSDFVGEAQKASAALAVMEAEGKKTGTTLAKTGAVVDGFGNTAGTAFQGMAKDLRSVDQSMAAFGVSITPVINVMSELGTVIGRTASSLSLLEKASVVLAVAVGAWQTGRWIAEMTGLDSAMSDLGATIQGKTTPAFEAWKNNIDLGRRAIGAGFQGDIMDTAGAAAYLGKIAADNAETFNTSAHRIAAWEAEIEKAAASGALDQIVADLESQNSSLQQLHKHYGISTEALQYLQRELAKNAAATREQAQADQQAANEARRHAEERQKLQDSLFGFDLIAKAQEYLDALGDISQLTLMSTEKQAEMNKVVGAGIEALRQMGGVGTDAMNKVYIATLPLPPITAGLTEEWNSVGESVNANADAIIADLKRMEDETKAYEAETQRIVDEWNKVKPPVDATTGAVQQQTAAVGQLTVQMQNFGRVNQSVWEDMAAGLELMEAYSKAGVAMGTQTALGGYNFGQITAPGITPTSATAARSLTVTVNNAQAQDIAERLTTEMRRSGVRF